MPILGQQSHWFSIEKFNSIPTLSMYCEQSLRLLSLHTYYTAHETNTFTSLSPNQLAHEAPANLLYAAVLRLMGSTSSHASWEVLINYIIIYG